MYIYIIEGGEECSFFFERLSQHGAKRQNSQLKCSCVATKSKL